MCAWQAVGQASGHRDGDTRGWLWLRVVFENAGRERGLLTREDLLLCASSCKSWRFYLLAMLPPGAPCCEGIVRTRLELLLKEFREGLRVHTVLERLAWALRSGPIEAQTIATDFILAHLSCSAVHAEDALDELLEHQPENVQVELEELLMKVVVDAARPDGSRNEQLEAHLMRLHERRGERRMRRMMESRSRLPPRSPSWPREPS
jgi:hypothetical protein